MKSQQIFAVMSSPRLATRLIVNAAWGQHALGRHVGGFSAYQKYYTHKRYLKSYPRRDGKNPGNQQELQKDMFWKASVVAAIGGAIFAIASYRRTSTKAHSLEDGGKKISNSNVIATTNRGKDSGGASDITNGRIYTRKEVAEHNSLDKGVWITYKGRVYDITEFVRHHPGGSHTIMMGAGGDVEPFWQTYTVHHASEVQRLLSQYQIGQLTPEDQREMERMMAQDSGDENNPYANDPKRNPLLQVHSRQPFNAETPASLLMPTYLTPTDILFVRNHLPVPEVDLDDYSLSICRGTDGDPDNLQVLAELTLDDLKTKFTPHTVDCVLQCSGNRRSDLKKIKEIKGLDWKVGAMGNVRFTGVKLVDLLSYLKLDTRHLIERDNVRHLQLEGLDCDMTGQSYAASVSADYAFDPNKEVLLAYEMNGQPLTRDHGFPLRFVAPGVTGARQVKWLGKIILSHEESHGHWQRKDYKSFSPNVDMFNLDFNKAVSIQETPVQSAICEPAEGQLVQVDRREPLLPVKGYAYSGGGKMIVRVDVSVDGGQTWMTAKLEDVPITSEGLPDYTRRNQMFSWTRWSLDVPLDNAMLAKRTGEIELLCRAFDSSYNSQPERAETVWNVRGVVNNSWHRVKLGVKIE